MIRVNRKGGRRDKRKASLYLWGIQIAKQSLVLKVECYSFGVEGVRCTGSTQTLTSYLRGKGQKQSTA